MSEPYFDRRELLGLIGALFASAALPKSVGAVETVRGCLTIRALDPSLFTASRGALWNRTGNSFNLFESRQMLGATLDIYTALATSPGPDIQVGDHLIVFVAHDGDQLSFLPYGIRGADSVSIDWNKIQEDPCFARGNDATSPAHPAYPAMSV